jgi:hypothetical protein
MYYCKAPEHPTPPPTRPGHRIDLMRISLTALLALLGTTLTALFWLSSAMAQSVADTLYDAEVPVMSQSDADRRPATRSALETIIVRIVGSRDRAVLSAALEAVGSEDRYLQRYGYRNDEDGTLLFTASFDGQALERTLRDARLPIWGRNRPEVLVWIDAGGRLSAADDAEAFVATYRAALARGVPLRFPRMDASDRGLLSPVDIGRGDVSRILNASDSYQSPMVLAGQLRNVGGIWRGQWLLLDRSGNEERWVSTGLDADAATAEGVHGLADRMARQLAIRDAGSLQDIDIVVHGVRNLSDYLAATSSIGQLNLVSNHAVLEAAEDRLIIRARTEGDRDALERALASARHLRRERPAVGSEWDIGALEYRIVR